MNWLDQKIDRFIQRTRDNPAVKRIPIGPNPDDPTYYRWFVIPRNRFLNIYLHNFKRDDEEHLHDHRMMNISFILQGDYYEERFVRRPTEGLPLPATQKVYVRGRRPKFRLPSTPHRVVLARDADGNPIPCWSLFIGFPQVRNWGFWCPGNYSGHWRSFEEYVSDPNPLSPGYGKVGRGCD